MKTNRRGLQLLTDNPIHEKCHSCERCSSCGRFHPCKRFAERPSFCVRHEKTRFRDPFLGLRDPHAVRRASR